MYNLCRKSASLVLLFVVFSVFAIQAFATEISSRASKQNANTQFPVTIGSNNEIDVAVGIGSGVYVSRYPITEYYWFTRNQSLYTAAEIGRAGMISHLRWYPTTARSWANTGGSNQVKIYIGTTSSSSLTSQTYSTSGLTLVYQNNSYTGVSVANAWQEFDITDYYYNGTENLIVVTEINLANWSSPSTGEDYRNSGTSGIYLNQHWERDNTPPVVSGTLDTLRPNLQIEFSTSAPALPILVSPANNATNIAVTTAVNWTNGANTANVDLFFSNNQALVSAMDTTVRVLSASTATTFDPTGDLNAGVTYYWRVLARNAGGETTAGTIWQFTTASPPLTGTKTVGGTSPDYPTFTDAINALIAYGVGSSGITFSVRPGTYNERIVIPQITGASTTSHIIFQKESGTVTVAMAGTSGSSDAIVKLNAADYIELRGIDVLDLGTDDTNYNEYGFYVTNSTATNGANGNIIANSTITMHRANVNSRAIFQNYSITPTAQTGANSDNKYLDLKISNTAYGIFINSHSTYRDLNTEIGSTSSDLAYANRTVIGNGGIDDIGSINTTYGIYIGYAQRTLIHDCDIQNLFTSSPGTSVYGVTMMNTYGISELYNNRIFNLRNTSGSISATGYMYGVYANASSGAGNEIRVYNNYISGFSNPRTSEVTTVYLYGIYSSQSSGLCYIDHNAILMNPSTVGASTTCLQVSNTSYVRNNILANTTPNQFTAKHYIILTITNNPVSNYNSYYLPNLYGGYFGISASTDRLGIDDWRAYTSQDNQSTEGNPRFVDGSSGNLHIQAGVKTAINNTGTPIAWVTTDINGIIRNTGTPDIGPNEGIFVSTTPLMGTKTVGGTSADYATLVDAVEALAKYGIGTNGVTFSVRPGTYNGPITIPYLPDASDRTPANFIKESGTVTVTATGTSGNYDAILRLQGCDWVTFDGIDFVDGGSSSADYCEFGVWVGGTSGTNGATNNTIKNSTITMHRANSNANCVYQYSYNQPVTYAGTNNYNHYLNLKLSNARNGIYVFGNSSNYDYGTEIGSTSTDPSFASRFTVGSGGVDDIGTSGYHCYGIFAYYQDGIRIHDCDVSNVTASASGYNVYGIAISYTSGTCYLNGNRIYNLRQTYPSSATTGNIYGILLSNFAEMRVTNNMISGLSHARTTEVGSFYIYGIYQSSGTTIYVDNNSFLLNPTNGNVTNACLFLTSGTQYVRNNIFVNRTPNQTTSKHYAIYMNGGTLTSNYNLFQIPNQTNGIVGYNSSDYATLDAWQQNTGRDYNSLQGEPRFRDEANNNLRITPNVYTPINNSGTPVATVLTDAFGTTRNATTPDIGAEEGNFVAATPLTGIKTIGGTTPDYPTFTAALSDLQLLGVGTGGVIFLVRPGVYTEQLVVLPINNTSSTNPVIFQRDTGPVTLTCTGTVASNDYIVKLMGCRWVTFDGINVTDAGTSTSNYVEYGYYVTNLSGASGAQNNTIKNATIILNRVNTGSIGVMQDYSLTPVAQTGANNSNHYLNLKISNVRYGIYLRGSSNYRDQSVEIGSTSTMIGDTTRLTIGSGGVDDLSGSGSIYGIYMTYQEAVRVHDCDISNLTTTSTSSGVFGIYTSYLYGVNEISANRIYNLKNGSGDISASGSLYGAFLYAVTGTGNEIRFYNNTISGFTHSRTTEVNTIYTSGVYASNGFCYIDNNSIAITPSMISNSSTGIYIVGATTTIRNNIITNVTGTQTTAKHYGIVYNSGSFSNSNNNLFHIPNVRNGFIGYYTADQLTLDSWQGATGYDYTSKIGNPLFLNESANDLRILPGTASPVNNSGTPIVWITRDLENTTRHVTTPDIGAQEGNFISSAPLTGTKTIGGTSPDYATFTDALTALQLYGVGSGGVTFSVRPGVYSEQLVVLPISGTSMSNPVIFQRESDAVTVSVAGTSLTTDAAIKLFGCDWVTFDGINVQDAGTSSDNYLEYGYQVMNQTGANGATNNTIKNARIAMNRIYTGSYGVYQNLYVTPSQQSGANSSNHYLNLKITNCRTGMYFTGNGSYHDQFNEIGSTTSVLADTNRMVIGCYGPDDIGSATSSYGMYLINQDAIRVHDADICNVGSTSVSGASYGIMTSSLYGTSEIFNNRIYNIRNASGDANASGGVYGAVLNASTTGTNELRFYNNTISGINHPRTTETTSIYMMGIYATSGVCNVYNNSVLVNPTTIGCSNTVVYVNGATLTLMNNILMNRTANQSTAKHYIIYYSGGTLSNSNYNLIYYPNVTNGSMGYYTSEFSTLDAWQQYYGYDPQSRQGNPFFANEVNNDLRIVSGAASPVNNNGYTTAWITRDIEGTLRNATNPDIGAHEGNFTSSAPLTGIKTIGGTSPDYASFTDALNALQIFGVGTGGVTFNARPGTYAEQLTVLPITGASTSNPVIFRRESDPVTIAVVGGSGTTDAAVKLNGCDWVTFDGINVTDLGTSSSNYLEYGYYIVNFAGANGATNNTIKNATIVLNRTNTSSSAIYQNVVLSPTSTNGTNSYNKYLNLKISNTRWGISLFGHSTYRDIGCEIGSISGSLTDLNRLSIGFGGSDDIGSTSQTYGMYISAQEGIRIHDCDIGNLVSSSTSSSVIGVYMTNCYGVNEISGSRIYNLKLSGVDANSTGSLIGIYVNNNTTAGIEVRCFNNMISNFSHPRTVELATMYVYGICVNSGTCYIDNNNIVMNGLLAGVSNANIYESSSNASISLRNNILINRTAAQTTSKHYLIYRGSATLNASNNNLLYILNSSNGFVGYYSSDLSTWDNWYSNTSFDNNSIVGNPFLMDETNNDLRVTVGTATPINNAGTPIAWITRDLEGNLRNVSTPDIGAQEGNFISSNPLTGIKTIGGVSPDYATFNDATTALQLYGVGSGGVTFLVRPGTYQEAITVLPIYNTSTTNPVIFRKQSNTVIVAPVGTSGNDAAIKLVGCNWVTFDGIDVSDSLNTSLTNIDFAYQLTNYTGRIGATNNTIQNSIITLNRTVSTSRGIYQMLSYTPLQQSGANSYNRFLNLKIGNARYGVFINANGTYHDIGTEIGSNPTDLTASTRFTIGFNGQDDIGGAGATYGIYATSQEAIRIHDCDVQNMFTSVSTSSIYAVYLNSTYGVSEISGTRIGNLRNTSTDVAATGNINGINASIVSGTHELRVFNNFISGFTHPRTTESATLYLYGAIFSTGTIYCDNNTIVMNPNTVGSSNANISATSAVLTARNNILYNSTGVQSTAKHYGFYCPTGTSLAANYNVFQLLNTGAVFGYLGTSSYTTLATWRTGSGSDNNSVASDPYLTDIVNRNLHIQVGLETPVSNAGTQITWITKDIDSETRSNPPDIGADEGYFGFIVINPNPASNASNVPTNTNLSWSASPYATGYDVYFGPSSPPSLVSSNQTGTTYTPSSSLVRNSPYFWKVIPRNGATVGTGLVWSFTTGAGAAPNGPISPTITGVTGSSQVINWVDNSNDETGFLIQSSTDGSSFTNLISVTAGTTSWSHNVIPSNTHYWYRVYAYNASGNSVSYAEVNSWTLANVPQSPTIGTIGSTFVQLTPRNGTTTNPAITTYAIFESRTGLYVQADGTMGTSVVWRTLTDWATITVNGLTASAPHGFSTKARNGGNVETALSTASTLTTASVSESFAGTSFPPLGWSITNSDGSITWSRFTGTNSGNGTATVNFPAYYPGTDQQDVLWSPAFSTLNVGDASVSFQWWYQSGYSGNDGLEVLLSTDSGATSTSLWLRRGVTTTPNLGTGTTGTLNYPAASDWSAASISLPISMLNQSSLRIGFRSYNQYGPAVFLDNVNISTTQIPRYAFSPTTFDFGESPVHSNTQSNVWVVNRGTEAVQITSAAITGPKFATAFSLPMTIPVSDSIPLTLTFNPDTTITFRDTLRIQLSTGAQLTLPVSGLGFGNYISLSRTSVSFPNVIEPTRSDSITVYVRVQGNASLEDAYFTTLSGPFSGGPNPWVSVQPGDSGAVKLYFQPMTQGVFSGSIAFVCSAINTDTIRITLSGTAAFVPAAPGGLTITRASENALLNWARVDTSLNGVPLTVGRYLIYYRDNGTGPWYFLTFTEGASTTSYTHVGVFTYSPAMYYRIKAWIGTGSSDSIIDDTPSGTPEAVMMKRLDNDLIQTMKR